MARLPHSRPQALSWPVARCPPGPAHGRTAGGLASVSGELHLEESFSTACSRLGREETAGSCEATVLRATLLPGQPVGPLHGCARWTFLKLARGPRPIGARVTHSPISEPGSNRYTDSHTQPHTNPRAGRSAPGCAAAVHAPRPRGPSRARSQDRVRCFTPRPYCHHAHPASAH